MKAIKLLPGLGVLILTACHAWAATYYVNVANPAPAAPFTNWPTAATNIQSAIDAATDGDLVLVTNGIYQTGGRVVYGSLTNRVAVTKAVTVQSANGPAVTTIQGYQSAANSGSNNVRCVYLSTNAVLSGFTLTNGGTLNAGDWYLDESGAGVWTTNNSTAVVSNCVLIKNVAQGMGGAAYNGIIYSCSIVQNSAYDGGGVGCQGNSIMVTSSLIISNSATGSGGGAWGATLENCAVLQNTAADGGGASASWLYGCLVASNTASQLGGGIYQPNAINDCTIVGNTASQGPGGFGGTGLANGVGNSIIYYNIGANGLSSNYLANNSIILSYCCTTPLNSNPIYSVNSFTNDPAFVDAANGNYHLQSNSLCINSGGNQTFVGTDLDGNPRTVDGFVDIGAYEYQTAKSILPYYWAQQYGLPLDGTIDTDGDGMDNWQEAVAGTNPTNAASVIKMLSVSNSVSGATVKWQGVSSRKYYLQYSTNLAGQPAFSTIRSNIYNIFGGTTITFKETNAAGAGPYFYRVGVQ